MSLSKSYRDDEYYTTRESAEKFFELVVVPSGILRHKTLLMPFTTIESPLYKVAKQYHENIIVFSGDMDLWSKVNDYEDVAVVDNPPFSMSSTIEKYYIENDIPFILFRSAVLYPKFLYKEICAGVIFENSKDGVSFLWGIGNHTKRIPVAFSFYRTNYSFKVKTVTFSELRYPIKKECCFYLNRGVFDGNTNLWIDEKDKRVHLLSY